jgi:NADH:ubiquinone reductase (H+-translocating)
VRELAGQIAELSRRALQRNYRTVDPRSARVILIEATDTVLRPFPEPLRRRAQRDLEQLGVEVRLHTMVTGVDPGGLDVKHEDHSTGRIQAYTKIWAAGVQASPLGRILGEQSGATVDRAGRVSVLDDCTLPGHPEVFVVGDLMSLDHLPGVAEVAMQSGIHAAHIITHRLKGDTGQRPFRYRDLGTMATIARFRALMFIGRIHVTGLAAWLLWLLVHLAFLTGFKNRLAAVANWAIAFLGHDRRQRTITEQQVFARTRGMKRPEAGAPDRAFLGRPSGRGCR